MLFADLMNSTEMAKNLTLEQYDGMLVDFQSTMFDITSNHLREFGYAGNGADSEWSIAGDELRVFLYSGSLRFDVRNALLIAVKIKLGWLTSDFNQRILKEGRLVSRIGVGINCGKVSKDVRRWRASIGQEHPVIEGYALNLTKRVESASREGTVYQVMVGDSLYQFCRDDGQINVAFSEPRNDLFKGLGQKIAVYEVISFLNYEIVHSMPESYRKNLLKTIEYAVSQPMPEPWILLTLLRTYISEIAVKGREFYASKAIKLAHQAFDVLEYKKFIYNILGWLYTYCHSVLNLETAFHYFDQTLELDPRDQTALLHRARISEMMGNLDFAKRTYEEILILNTEHLEASRKLAHYQEEELI